MMRRSVTPNASEVSKATEDDETVGQLMKVGEETPTSSPRQASSASNLGVMDMGRGTNMGSKVGNRATTMVGMVRLVEKTELIGE